MPLAALAAPVNDDFAAAKALDPVSPSSLLDSNVEAGKESGEPDHAGNSGGHSVWYSWTPAASGPAGISTACFGGLDTLLAVYTGAGLGALTPIASNEGLPASSCFGEVNEVEFDGHRRDHLLDRG